MPESGYRFCCQAQGIIHSESYSNRKFHTKAGKVPVKQSFCFVVEATTLEADRQSEDCVLGDGLARANEGFKALGPTKDPADMPVRSSNKCCVAHQRPLLLM